MQINQLKDLYQRNKINHEQLIYAIEILEMLECFADDSIDSINEEVLDGFVAHLVEKKMMSIDSIVVLMRYYKMIKRNDLYIQLTKYTGGLGVIESILERLDLIVGKTLSEKIKSQIDIPKLGTHPSQIPKFTESFMSLLETTLDKKTVEKVLASNHHQISEKVYLDERILYEQAETLDQYLKELHQRKVQILEKHLKENTVWFEQNITKEVVDFVRQNQEVLSAVRKQDKLLITKIPYDVEAYLKADSNEEKAYHACHCPFAKESVKNNGIHISDTWCYCSAGFAKFPFEVLFDKELKVEVLQNVLKGDPVCRFSLSLENIDYKK